MIVPSPRNLIFLALLAGSVAVQATASAGPVVDAAKAGVAGDGITVNTAGIQRLIDACSKAGGGTIEFTRGQYVTGTIELKSNVTMRVDDGATLLGSTNPTDYRNLDPFVDGSGNPMGYALVIALNAEHVGLEGPGTIDGRSPLLKANEAKYTMRPFLVRWVHCAHVAVRDIHLKNPGAWTLHFLETNDAVVEKVTIRSRDLGMPNNDGIDIDSSEHVQVRDCDVVSGDDSLVIKATSKNHPTRDITASDCALSSHTNAIKLGTESIGGFEDIAISHCSIRDTRMCGIALYEVDGADLHHVTVSDVTMDGVAVPISIRLGARLKTFRPGDEPRPHPGRLYDVSIRNVSAKNVGMIGMLINGIPGHPIEALRLENIHLIVPGGCATAAARVELPEQEKAYPEYDMFGKVMPAYGAYLRHIRGLTMKDVDWVATSPDARPAQVEIDVAPGG